MERIKKEEAQKLQIEAFEWHRQQKKKEKEAKAFENLIDLEAEERS